MCLNQADSEPFGLAIRLGSIVHFDDGFCRVPDFVLWRVSQLFSCWRPYLTISLASVGHSFSAGDFLSQLAGGLGLRSRVGEVLEAHLQVRCRAPTGPPRDDPCVWPSLMGPICAQMPGTACAGGCESLVVSPRLRCCVLASQVLAAAFWPRARDRGAARPFRPLPHAASARPRH